MGRKQDINQGAAMACLVVAVIVVFGTWSFWAGVMTFFLLGAILSLLRIIR